MQSQVEWRAFRQTMLMSAAAFLGDSPLFLADVLLRFLRVLLLLGLWRVLFAGRSVDGLSLDAVLTYTLVAEVFAEQFRVRTRLEEFIWDGTLVQRLTRPVTIVGQVVSEMVGRWLYGFATVSLPLLLLAPAIGVRPWPADPAALLWFVPSLLCAISLSVALDFFFSGIMLRLEQNSYVFRQVQFAVSVLFSGAMLPLAVYPWGLGEVFGWLPFAATASIPLRIYTGAVGPEALLIQVGWMLALIPLATHTWRANRERLVTYDG